MALVSGALLGSRLFVLFPAQEALGKRTFGVCVAESSPGECVSSAWVFVFAIGKVVRVLRVFAAFVAWDALFSVPVVGTTAAEYFVAVGSQVREQALRSFACALLS